MFCAEHQLKIRMRAPAALGSILHAHYDNFKHESSGKLLVASFSGLLCVQCFFEGFVSPSEILRNCCCHNRCAIRTTSTRVLGTGFNHPARCSQISGESNLPWNLPHHRGDIFVMGYSHDKGAIPPLFHVSIVVFLWFRVHAQYLQDFERKVQKDSTNKAKVSQRGNAVIWFKMLFPGVGHLWFGKNSSWFMAVLFCHFIFGYPWVPLKKAAQLDEEQSMVLFDICCLWLWLKENMVKAFDGATVDQHELLFHKGKLGLKYYGPKTRQTFPYGIGWRQPSLFHWSWLVSHNSRHIFKPRVGPRQNHQHQSTFDPWGGVQNVIGFPEIPSQFWEKTADQS